MVGVLTCAPTLKDPLCAVVELDSSLLVMDKAAMVSRHITEVASTGEGRRRRIEGRGYCEGRN